MKDKADFAHRLKELASPQAGVKNLYDKAREFLSHQKKAGVIVGTFTYINSCLIK